MDHISQITWKNVDFILGTVKEIGSIVVLVNLKKEQVLR